VIVFQWWQPFFGPLVGTLARLFRRAGLKCIIECHNVISHEGSPFDKVLVRFALSAVDDFITHSTKDREHLLKILPGKSVTVSGLPPVEEFYAPAAAREPSGHTILFFGTVRKYKGLSVLLEAMPKVLQKVECNLIVVGEFYDSIEKYRQLIREHHIENHVHLDNRYVPNEEVTGLFHKADVLVLPYLSATQSGVARIAITNGLPVIASKTGGLSEAVKDGVNGLLFPPGDSQALADRLVRYFGENLGTILSKHNSDSSTAGSDCTIIETIERIAQTSLPARI